MKTLARIALTLLTAVTFAAPSQAAVIVDTGAGQGSYYGGSSLDRWQNLAAGFTLDQDYNVTGLNAWMASPWGTTVRMSIMSTANGLPSTALFSTDVTVDASMSQNWVGASSLSWNLAAGDYVVAFGTAPGYTLRGSMAKDAPNPSGPMFFTDELGNWHKENGAALGLQLFGTAGAAVPADVPEPASIALLGLALGAMALSRRKRA